MNHFEDIGSNVDFGPKGANFDQKGLKRAGIDFSRTSNINFTKEDNKTSIHTKNQQNSMNCLEDLGSNVNFGPKRCKFGQKRAQKGRNQIFLELSLVYFINRPKM